MPYKYGKCTRQHNSCNSETFFRGEKQWRPKKIVSRSKRGFCEIKRGKILANFGGCF